MFDETFSYTSQYLTKNQKPWFPIMGEFHYSRFAKEFWKESILKMKAGGVTIVSSYVIWIHHEEIKDQWDWSGQRDLRAFVQTIKECGLHMILRVGPWSHAEARNGGFPDWLQNGYKVRTNDSAYFEEVKKFYEQIYQQVQGLLLKDSGPIIGLQIENEFGHCGGLTGAEGEKHMKTLQAMAKEAGFDVPLWTATGWGGAVTAGMLPVMGGYVDAPWDQRPVEIEPSGNYVITHERNDHNIGSDFGFGKGITFDMTKFPYLTAELGGGLEPTFLRRPVPSKEDIGAETLVKMASGVSLLGYYMYHGGTNPDGKLTTLEENKATGSLNDLCQKSYDFFAPLKEYGQTSPTYGELKLYALFAADFGSDLCKMPSEIPQDNPLSPEDTKALRHSFRINKENGQGYLFVNNYVRHQKQEAHKDVCLEVPGTKIKFGPFDVNDGDYFFLPFKMPVGDALLETSTATPLCKINGDFVFYKTSICADEKNAFNFKENKKPSNAKIILLSREQALKAYKIVRSGKEYLVIFDGELFDDGKTISLRGQNPSEFYSYPELPFEQDGWTKSQAGDLTKYSQEKNCKQDQNAAALPKITVTPSGKKEASKKFYDLTIGQWQRGSLDDILLNLYFDGSYARLYKDSKLVADNLFCGKDIPWQLALRFFESGSYELEIQELKEGEKVYLQDWPNFKNGVACAFVRADSLPLYKICMAI